MNQEELERLVNRYPEDFLLVAFLHRESYPLLTIRKITKLSERLIKEYISLIERAESEGYRDRLNQLLDQFKVNEPLKNAGGGGAMTDKRLVKREYAKKIYGPLQGRTLRNVLIKKLIDGYGYSDKLEIAKRLVDDFLDTVDRFSPSVDRVKPGQLVWIARSESDKQGYGKNSANTGAKRAVLSLVTEEDLDILVKDGKVEPIKDKRMVRLINEAKQQGAVLSQADLTAIMLLSSATLSKRTRKYQKEAGKLLPTAGNVLDIGRGITHKRVIVELYAKGYNPPEIARMTDHELKNVETYIEDMERVRIVASKDKQTISRLTRLSVSLVEEYLEIIRTYYPECMHLNRMEGNIEGNGN